MCDLTIIKLNSDAYIDSREVAEAIGKNHKDLLRDIRGYISIIEKTNERNFAPINFFLESSYLDRRGREKPCYLLTKLGCELCANKLIGEKGILFTAAYVAKFNAMEAAERDAQIKAHAKSQLNEFNSAARNILSGLSQCYATSDTVMKFLRGVYEPLGIEVLPLDFDDYLLYYTATEIAQQLGIYSESGRPHGHAVAAIITKLPDPEHHAVAVPFGLSGVSIRYDFHMIELVRKWITDNNFPREVPYKGFDYHLYYDRHLSMFDYNANVLNLNVDIRIYV